MTSRKYETRIMTPSARRCTAPIAAAQQHSYFRQPGLIGLTGIETLVRVVSMPIHYRIALRVYAREQRGILPAQLGPRKYATDNNHHSACHQSTDGPRVRVPWGRPPSGWGTVTRHCAGPVDPSSLPPPRAYPSDSRAGPIRPPLNGRCRAATSPASPALRVGLSWDRGEPNGGPQLARRGHPIPT